MTENNNLDAEAFKIHSGEFDKLPSQRRGWFVDKEFLLKMERIKKRLEADLNSLNEFQSEALFICNQMCGRVYEEHRGSYLFKHVSDTKFIWSYVLCYTETVDYELTFSKEGGYKKQERNNKITIIE